MLCAQTSRALMGATYLFLSGRPTKAPSCGVIHCPQHKLPWTNALARLASPQPGKQPVHRLTCTPKRLLPGLSRCVTSNSAGRRESLLSPTKAPLSQQQKALSTPSNWRKALRCGGHVRKGQTSTELPKQQAIFRQRRRGQGQDVASSRSDGKLKAAKWSVLWAACALAVCSVCSGGAACAVAVYRVLFQGSRVPR